MKRSHNYSSSDSDLDDTVEVEKDSGDENGYVNFFFLFFKENQPIRHVLIKNWLFLRYSLHILFFLSAL